MTSLSELSENQNIKKSRDQKSSLKMSCDQKLTTANNQRSIRPRDQTNRKSKPGSMSKYKHEKFQKLTEKRKKDKNSHATSVQNHLVPTSFKRPKAPRKTTNETKNEYMC